MASSVSGNFFKPLFGGFDMSDLPTSELRPLSDTAFGAIKDRYNLQGMAPAFANTLRNRAAASVPQFQLGAALGQFGQPGIANNEVQLGGQGVQGRMADAAANSLGGGPTSSSFQDFLTRARHGLNKGGGQAASILEALGVSGSESAEDAYGGIRSNFINPRVNLLPAGLRSIVGAGISGQMEDLFGGRGSAEISPADALKMMQNRGMIF